MRCQQTQIGVPVLSGELSVLLDPAEALALLLDVGHSRCFASDRVSGRSPMWGPGSGAKRERQVWPPAAA